MTTQPRQPAALLPADSQTLAAFCLMVGSTTFSLDRYAPEVRTRVDQALAERTEFGPGCPGELREAIRYSLLAPG
jgi:hypothetical protein